MYGLLICTNSMNLCSCHSKIWYILCCLLNFFHTFTHVQQYPIIVYETILVDILLFLIINFSFLMQLKFYKFCFSYKKLEIFCIYFLHRSFIFTFLFNLMYSFSGFVQKKFILLNQNFFLKPAFNAMKYFQALILP